MDYQKILKNHGLKITKPRLAILELLYKNERGLDAESIKLKIQEDDLYIDLSTVYRTLETFYNNNIVSRFDLGDKKYNYKIKVHNHVHNLQCEICGKNYDLECPMNLIEELITKETGFSLTSHKIELKGICRECQEKFPDEHQHNHKHGDGHECCHDCENCENKKED